MISALIIARDEEANIGPCLDSLRGLADEAIVVVDSASSDSTEAIARERGARVWVRDWQGFSATKQWGLMQAKGDWVLWLDADERVTPELSWAIKQEIDKGANFSALAFPRQAFFLGRWIRHCGWYPGYVTRLFRSGQAHFDDKLVHEGLVVDGPVKRLDQPILHYTDPDLDRYLVKFNRYTELAARQMHDAERRFRLTDLLFRPPAFFLKMYLIKAGFLDGYQGFVLSVLSACYVTVKYLKLWERGLDSEDVQD